jgi:hypothetical protein
LEAGVCKALELLLHGRLQHGMAVASVHHGNATCKVDIAPTFDIPNFRTLCAIHKYFEALTQSAGQCCAATRHQIGIRFHSIEHAVLSLV